MRLRFASCAAQQSRFDRPIGERPCASLVTGEGIGEQTWQLVVDALAESSRPIGTPLLDQCTAMRDHSQSTAEVRNDQISLTRSPLSPDLTIALRYWHQCSLRHFNAMRILPLSRRHVVCSAQQQKEAPATADMAARALEFFGLMPRQVRLPAHHVRHGPGAAPEHAAIRR